MQTIFNTDYYQLTMMVAYMLEGKANDKSGFELFIRRVHGNLNPDKTHYVMDCHDVAVALIEQVKEEMKDKNESFNLFWDLIAHKTNPKFKEELSLKWASLDTEFSYNVLADGDAILPFVPVVQISGPRWIGQLLETVITNKLNGIIGRASYLKFNDVPHEEEESINNIMFKPESDEHSDYILLEVGSRLEEYRDATSTMLFEASFRRAPTYEIAGKVAKMAVDGYDWNGTSNVGAKFDYGVDINKIGGSCAHAFIMSFDTELEAFKAWYSVYPDSTMLVDTYDTMNAIKMLIEHNIKPLAIRIDSGVLHEEAVEARAILNDAGWTDVKIYLSGDITPEYLIEMHENNVPFDMCMAGTKLVNIGLMKNVNAGFVYKLVEYTDATGKVVYPVKKSSSKGSIPSLKQVHYDESRNEYFFTAIDTLNYTNNTRNHIPEDAKLSSTPFRT
jgi:nicotinate phosphoribosyltransferase